MKKSVLIILVMIVLVSLAGKNAKQSFPAKPKDKITTNKSGKGPEILLNFIKGPSFYYPIIAIWLEDTGGNYIQTLYVSKSVTTRIFSFAMKEANKWVVVPIRATKSLPYWAHKKYVNVPGDIYVFDDQPVVPDAYTGATPKAGFLLKTHADNPLPDTFKVMMEINQKWDRNEYWTPNKYSGDEFYKLSCQPALVYEAIVEKGSPRKFYPMKVIGHSHYSGMTGELYTDLSTLTTALSIADSVIVRIKGR
jgi:hypothetical protein